MPPKRRLFSCLGSHSPRTAQRRKMITERAPNKQSYVGGFRGAHTGTSAHNGGAHEKRSI